MELWNSPIEAEVVSSSQISFQELHVDGESVFWTESRPLEKGRHALMKKEGGSPPVELFPSMSIQSKVHEYGGGAFFAKRGTLIFFDLRTFSLYVQKDGSAPVCLMQDPLRRFADFSLSPDLTKIVCVCEDHSKEEVQNYLVVFDLKSHSHHILHQGFDFYAAPQWSPDGKKIAFIFWNFPAMPWEESALKVISFDGAQELFSIGSSKESVSEFIWTAAEEILFASDRNGFFNLYFWNPQGETLFYKEEADFSAPLWVLGKKNFKKVLLEGKEYFIVHSCKKAVDSLGIIDRESRTLRKLDLPYTVIRALDVGAEMGYFVGGSEKEPLSLVFLDLKTFKSEVICASLQYPDTLKPFISTSKEVSTLSSLDQKKIFGFFYFPKNPAYEKAKLPPMIIKCHSGPTAHAQALLSLEVQFWTSRGFAFLDVNYRGSSGFGREYREALNYNWGVLDVQDCLDLARSLVEEGIVDGRFLFAKGSSAGGFTALCIAAVSSELRGCVSYYGVTDLSLLIKDTHKFERTYLDFLVGKHEEFLERYSARSPNQRSEQITCPVFFVHGDQDFVVPLAQAKELHKKLPKSELMVIQGEGHGFRRADTIKACLEAERLFYSKILSSGEEL